MQKQSTEFKTGTLKWFHKKRGFGFIIPDDAGPDVFVHAVLFNERKIEPKQYMRLKYRDIEGPKGMTAFDVEAVPNENHGGVVQ